MTDHSLSKHALPKPAVGTSAPRFKASVLDGNPNFAFDTVAGRPVVLFFFGSAGTEPARTALSTLLEYADLFDDVKGCFFGVSTDPDDATSGRIATRIPGIRHVLDHDRAVSIAYGACQSGSDGYEPYIVVLDRLLRVAGRFFPHQAKDALVLVERLNGEDPSDGFAPVLAVPRVLEPDVCRQLIQLYESGGGNDSGFMREVDGKTVLAVDHTHKRRSDFAIEDQELCRMLSARINKRLRPSVNLAFNFDANRMERYIIACYDAALGGHFRPHRDNTTKGTAHRRFAVTINLNDDFEGGELRFPEFGSRTYRAPPGGAIVFSCGLLHEARPVTAGRRYAFLPFLYDDAAAAEREMNNAYLGQGVSPYRQE